MKTYSRGLTVKNKSGGRCQARGAKTRIQASNMADQIIRGIDKPTHTPKPILPTKNELLDMIAQAHTAVVSHPDSVAAQRRYNMLMEVYTKFYK